MSTEANQISAESYVFPASFAQQRLWFLDRMERDSAAYNVPLVLRLRGRLDLEALQHALDVLVERHESLRTTFTVVAGVPHQLVAAPHPLALSVSDLRGTPGAEQAAMDLAAQETARTFDLTRGPLLRATLIRISEHDQLLVIALHHAIMDAWSMRVLNRELSALYGAFSGGSQDALPELTIQYGDYAVWQQEWIDGGGLAQQLAYWREHLAGAPTLLELPTDHPRPSMLSFRGARAGTVLSRALRDRLATLSEAHGATVFMTLLAAYVALLARYTGGDDIVVATPVANRNRLELEHIIGVFANTLPLRTSTAGNPSFLELLARVRETVLNGVSNQDLPFEKLVEELNPPRHLSHAPIAQAMFVHQAAAEDPVDWRGLDREVVATDRGTSKFDLTLSVAEDVDGLRTTFEYRTELFDEATVVRMLGHYETLLEAVVADPSRAVADLPLLGSEELSQLADFNRTDAPYPSACLHELFAAQAGRSPDAVAVECGEARLSYAELDRRSNRLADELVALGAAPGTFVGLCTERSVEQVVGMLGVLKAGAAYVPIDPGYPPERQAFVLADAQVAVLLTQAHLVAGLPEHDARIVLLDHDEGAVNDQHPAAVAPSRPSDPEQLAYVIYTSGSTGKPKGVQITHRSVVNLITHMRERPGIDEHDILVNLTTAAFDLSVPDFYLPLCHGARLVIVPREETLSGKLLAQRLARSGATIVQATPTTWQMLIDAGWPGADRLKIVCGGEALTRPLAVELRRRGAALWHMYGPTETTVWSSVLEVSAGEGPVPLGGPIANTTFHVLDDRRRPVPIGVPGELYIGGDGLARGYLNRPALTEEKFVSDPSGTDPSQRLYRSGDLMRWRERGELEFLGRVDHQIKLRGFRIELGEIEAVLREHPAVRDALVMARDDSPGDTRLVAYVLGDPVPDGSELRAFLSRSLPGYMVPAAFVALEAFPQTPNGKVDRRALPAPGLAAVASSDYAAPSTDLERELAVLWRRLLNLERIGIDDNFFEIGGHSLLAVQLVMLIEEELQRACTLPMLFRTGTIRALAAELRAGGADADRPAVMRLQADGDGPALFCICGVHAYQDLADALAPEFPVYGIFLPMEQRLLTGRAGTGAVGAPTVEAMAAGYVQAVREQQPDGPYMLLGFCFGGILAFEMANQLRAAGAQVEMLAMLDTVLPSIAHDWKRKLRRETRRLMIKAYGALPATVRRRVAPGRERAAANLTDLQRLEHLRSAMYVEARRRYRAPRYPGKALVVRPESMTAGRPDAADPSFGWSSRTGEVQVIDVPGTHLSHLKHPQVRELARQLRPHLQAARAAKRPQSG